MALDMFIKMGDEIKGESADKAQGEGRDRRAGLELGHVAVRHDPHGRRRRRRQGQLPGPERSPSTSTRPANALMIALAQGHAHSESRAAGAQGRREGQEKIYLSSMEEVM